MSQKGTAQGVPREQIAAVTSVTSVMENTGDTKKPLRHRHCHHNHHCHQYIYLKLDKLCRLLLSPVLPLVTLVTGRRYGGFSNRLLEAQ